MGSEFPKQHPPSAGSSSDNSNHCWSSTSTLSSLDRLIDVSPEPETDDLGYNALHHIVKHYADAQYPINLPASNSAPAVLPQANPITSSSNRDSTSDNAGTTNSDCTPPTCGNNSICPPEPIEIATPDFKCNPSTQHRHRSLDNTFLETVLQSPFGRKACMQTTEDGVFTPLHLCCRSMHTVPDEITRVIARANVDAIGVQDEEGDTPLHAAFRYGASDEIIRTLIELEYSRCSFDKIDEMILENDCEEEMEDCSCAFLKYNDDGETPLHTAISHEASEQSIQLLLDAYPQGILTPTIQFDAYNNYFIQNASHETMPHQSSKSPLHIASEYGRYDIIQVMMNSHAAIDSVEALLKMKDENGITPIYILWNQICDHIVPSHGDDVDSNDNDGASDNEMNEVEIMNAISGSSHERVNFDATLCEEILECIALLIKSSNPTDAHYTPQETFTVQPQDSSTTEIYNLLRNSILLGSHVVPEGYVSFLTKNHPEILRRKDAKGRLPLHLAAIHHDGHSTASSSSDATSCPSTRTHEEQSSVLMNHHQNNYNNNHGFLKSFGSSSTVPENQFNDTKVTNPQQQQQQCQPRGKVNTCTSTSTNTIFTTILKACPSAAFHEDNSGRLPLHYAINSGLSYHDEIRNLLRIHPISIGIKDPMTGLAPFMTAGATYRQSLDNVNTIFQLLQCSPDLIHFSRGDGDNNDGSNGNNNDKRRSSSPPSSNKRQRTS